jgi:hypothetical protein
VALATVILGAIALTARAQTTRDEPSAPALDVESSSSFFVLSDGGKRVERVPGWVI